MVSTNEGFTNDSTISPMTSTPVKKPSAGKLLCLFTNILDLKNKTATLWVGADESNLKAIKYGTTPRELKQKRKGNSKINDQIKNSLYNWIMHYPQVVQSPNVDDCMEVNIAGQTKPQLV